MMLEVLDALINTLWQSVLISLSVWLFLRFTPRINAATRYVVWWATLACVLILPFGIRVVSWARSHRAVAAAIPSRSAPKPLLTPSPAPKPDAAFLHATPAATVFWPRLVLWIWAAILLRRLVQILQSYIYLRGVKKRASAAPFPSPPIARRVRALVSCEIASPIAVGFLHPGIILPPFVVTDLSDQEREHVLLHEAEHLAGYDDWINLAERLLGGALALHPVATWIVRQIGREREIACDDRVVAKTGAACLYAESLVHLMELRESQRSAVLAVGMLGSRSRIGNRVERLLDARRTFSGRASRSGTLASFAGLAVLLFGGSLAPRWIALAQETVPEWQVKAGGKMAFDVASVKTTTEFRAPNIGLNAGPKYKPTGGLFSATSQLISFIQFAYKLDLAPDQTKAVMAQLPKWADTDRFDIQARAPQSNPTKDQMRLMMQSLLAERFHLAVHFETQTVPVFEMRLAKPGKWGPRILPHDEAKPCDAVNSISPSDKNFLAPCDNTFRIRNSTGTTWAGSRNSTMAMLAEAIPSLGDVTRAVVDRSGLSGRYDWMIEWTPETNGAPAPNGDVPADPAVSTFLQALKEQLGIKLEAAKAPIQVLIVDHVERPSAN